MYISHIRKQRLRKAKLYVIQQAVDWNSKPGISTSRKWVLSTTPLIQVCL